MMQLERHQVGEMARPSAGAATTLLRVERWLRTHPPLVGSIALALLVTIASLKVWFATDWALALSFVVPIFLLAYGVGPVAGATMAVVATAIWMLEVEGVEGAPPGGTLFALRLVTNLTIVALAALTSRAASAHERYLRREHELLRLHRELVSAFSHDLLTPLSTIVGYAEILRTDMASLSGDEIRDELDRIITNGRHVHILIRDMIGVERGAEDPGLEVSRFSPAALVADLQAELDHAPQAGGVTLHWEIDASASEFETDRTKLTSVVRNLVSNGIKFARRGDVWVRIDSENGTGAHRIEIKDSGPGIPPEKLPLIFGRFYRASDGELGFGLGLYIVKQFVDQLGGSVRVESEPGRGTAFVVSVPPPASVRPASLERAPR